MIAASAYDIQLSADFIHFQRPVQAWIWPEQLEGFISKSPEPGFEPWTFRLVGESCNTVPICQRIVQSGEL